MASEWRPRRIGDLGKVITGRTPPGTAEKYFGGDVLFLTPSDFDGGRYIERTARTLSPLGVDELKRVIVERGVAVSCIGWQMGKSVVIDCLTATNQQINTVVADESKVSLLFLYYSLLARRNQIFGLGSTATRTPIVNKSTFENIEILVPNLGEQHSIATILGSLDDKIELNRRMNATLEQMAQALFKSWFVDFDPVKAKAAGRAPEGMDADTAALFPSEFVESELGLIPKGWQCLPLKEAFEINPSRRLAKEQVADYLDMANVPTQGHRPVSWVKRPFGSGTRFINGDTLLARITPCLENGKTAFVDFLPEGESGWGSTEFIVLRPEPQLPEYFAYLLCREQDFRAFAIQSMTGTSGRQRVQTDLLGKYLVAAPSDEVAARFGEIIAPLVARISRNSEESNSLAEIRDALLPRLISGRLRIPEAVKTAEAVV